MAEQINSTENEQLTEDDVFDLLEAMCKFDSIEISDDYTNEELESVILELSQEMKEKQDSE